MNTFWDTLAYIGAVLAAIIFVLGMTTSQGAPQEAAVAGMALVIAFVPYAIARVRGAAAQRKLLQELLDQARKN